MVRSEDWLKWRFLGNLIQEPEKLPFCTFKPKAMQVRMTESPPAALPPNLRWTRPHHKLLPRSMQAIGLKFAAL